MKDVVYHITRNSLSDRVYSYIRDLILCGELAAGERIPEVTIAERFGVSRTPIREALKRLREYGLIEVKPRSFAQVATLPADEASDITEVRVALEVLAVRLLAERGNDEDYEAVASLAEECSKALAHDDIGKTFDIDSLLHLEIARRSRNRHLYDQMERLDAKIQLLRLVVHLPKEQIEGYIKQHSDIVAAVRAHNVATAQRIMERHIVDQLAHYRVRSGHTDEQAFGQRS